MVTPKKAKLRLPVSVIAIYCSLGLIFLGTGIWLANDLRISRASIIAERSALAVQTSKFISQWYGTTITSTDYVLRDITTKVSTSDLELAHSDPTVQKRLSAFVREKLATLPGVTGLGLLDKRAVFVGSADEKILGVQSNSYLHVAEDQMMENRVYVEYVPASKSANNQPAILVSRPILSPDGYLQGGALAAIMLSSAQDWITTFDIGEHATITMADIDGVLLASNPPRPDAIGTVQPSAVGQPSFGDQRDSASFTAISPVDGRSYIYGMSKVENIPLNIIIGYDEGYILHEWQQRVWQTLGGYLALLIMLGFVLSKHFEALTQRDEMQKLAITDPLTGVANRRQLISSGEMEIVKAIRYHLPTSVLMIDIDHFKGINDTWGHSTGDRVIQAIAQAMVANVRCTDIVGRLGGEEFAIVLTNTDPDGAIILANRLRSTIEKSTTVQSDNGHQVCFTVSIGVANLKEGISSFDEILGLADKALYDAKNRGRNIVVLA